MNNEDSKSGTLREACVEILESACNLLIDEEAEQEQFEFAESLINSSIKYLKNTNTRNWLGNDCYNS